MNRYQHILPEIEQAVGDHRVIPFPIACPACGAGIVSAVDDGSLSSASYACGAAYKSKPQIQNHTDKWWGTCPTTAVLMKFDDD
jgi:hypothetical protein